MGCTSDLTASGDLNILDWQRVQLQGRRLLALNRWRHHGLQGLLGIILRVGDSFVRAITVLHERALEKIENVELVAIADLPRPRKNNINPCIGWRCAELRGGPGAPRTCRRVRAVQPAIAAKKTSLRFNGIALSPEMIETLPRGIGMVPDCAKIPCSCLGSKSSPYFTSVPEILVQLPGWVVV